MKRKPHVRDLECKQCAKKEAQRFHPGEFIKDELAARGWTVEDLAAKSLLDAVALKEIIAGHRSVTPIFSMQLAKAFGVSRELFDNLQQFYDTSGEHRE